MSSLAIYQDIDDLLDDVKELARDYTDIDNGIQDAMMAGISKYTKYKNKMDSQILHYVAHVLNPHLKTEWIKKQIDLESATTIIRDIRAFLHQQYPRVVESALLELTPKEPTHPKGMSAAKFRIMKLVQLAIQRVIGSNVDRYLDSLVI